MTMLRTFRYLDPSLFQPSVFLLRPGPLEDELRALNVPVYRLPAHRMRNLLGVGQSTLTMARLIHSENIRLVHSNGFRPHAYGGLAAWLAQIPEVWTVHTPPEPTLFNRAILRIPATSVIANCPRTADSFRALGHPNEMIWPGVDIDRLERGTSREELSTRFGIPASARWVSLAARLQRYKGQHFFVRSLASLPRQEPAVHGILIGGALFGMEMDYLAELKAEAAKLGVADRVHFVGFLSDEDVAGFLAASELVVHPALDEDFGITVAEAQILGKPVIAFSAVGPTYILVDGKTGRLIPPGDQAALNRALAETLADPLLMRQWGQAGQERSRVHFGIVAHVQRTERIYERCIRENLEQERIV